MIDDFDNPRKESKVKTLRKKGLPPVVLIFLTFIALISIGTFLLKLPISSKAQPLDFVQSLFTATSAVCVTGLAVVDTFTQFTFFGQLVLLVLIQCGGLGLMTIATLTFIYLGKRITLKDRLVLQEAYNNDSLTGLLKLTQRIILLTFLIELGGAVVLSMSFVPIYGTEGFWMSIFHSVSAFCNAGFDLFGGGTSLLALQDRAMVLMPIGFLIILGGLGFSVIFDSFKTLTAKKRLPSHSKVVLAASLGLILFGFVLFAFCEWNNPATLGNLSFFDKILGAFFQAVTPRTAGFAAIDQGQMTPLSQSVTMLLMFIGASPASTGGGIKTTTFFVLVAMFIVGARGGDEVIIGGKSINIRTCLKAFSVFLFGLAVVAIVATTVYSIEFHLGKGFSFFEVLFESFSAFGTVGLSLGITGSLSNPSLILIAILMLIGRLGTLVLGLMFLIKHKNLKIRHPEAKIPIG